MPAMARKTLKTAHTCVRLLFVIHSACVCNVRAICSLFFMRSNLCAAREILKWKMEYLYKPTGQGFSDYISARARGGLKSKYYEIQ